MRKKNLTAKKTNRIRNNKTRRKKLLSKIILSKHNSFDALMKLTPHIHHFSDKALATIHANYRKTIDLLEALYNRVKNLNLARKYLFTKIRSQIPIIGNLTPKRIFQLDLNSGQNLCRFFGKIGDDTISASALEAQKAFHHRCLPV